MTFMPWNDAFSVGFNGIDEQHRWLFSATNRLYDELNKEARDRAVIADVIEGLMDYTMNHFIIEEELFQRYGYPQAQAHKALHDQFTATILCTLVDFENGADIGNDMLELLKNWLVQHITKTDKAYAPFFLEKGDADFHLIHA